MDAELAARIALNAVFFFFIALYLRRRKETADNRPFKFEFLGVLVAVVLSAVIVIATARQGDVGLAIGMAVFLVPLDIWALVRAWARRG